jgi:glycosyltransferase involved in cell wall biosynthesis
MLYNDLTIIIPCKNESKNLEFIIPKLKEYSNEIIVVDANSNDGSKEICELHSITYLKDNNLGKGDAQRIGANHSSREYIIFFDADGSHDENDIPKIYDNIKKSNVDLVICSRKTGGSFDLTANISWSGFVRAVGCDFLSLLLNKIHKTELSDVLYSLKAIQKEKFLNLKTTENHFGIELDIILKSIKKNYQIVEVPSREKKRVHGYSKLKTITGIYFIYQILRSKIYY